MENAGPGERAGDGMDESRTAVMGEVSLAVTSGLMPGAKLRENRLFRVSATRMVFEGELTLEQWHEAMRVIRFAKAASTIWLADAVSYGRRHFGDEEVKEALIQMEFDLADAQRARAIEGLEHGVRHVALSVEHYWVLSRAELSPEKQLEWSAVAVEHELTALQLQQSIAAGKVITKEQMGRNSGRGSGLATPHGIRQAYDLWYAQVEQGKPLQTWPLDEKRQLLEELRPIGELLRSLEQEVAGNAEQKGDELSPESAALVKEAVAVVKAEPGIAVTVSWLQRRFRLGYTRASVLWPFVKAAVEGGAQ